MHHMVLCAFGIRFYIQVFPVDAFATLAVEGGLNGAFGAGCYRFFGRIGGCTTTTGANTADDQRFIARVLKTERYIKCLTFIDLAIISCRINPLNGSELGTVCCCLLAMRGLFGLVYIITGHKVGCHNKYQKIFHSGNFCKSNQYSLILKICEQHLVKMPLYAFCSPLPGPYEYYPVYHLQTVRFAAYCIP